MRYQLIRSKRKTLALELRPEGLLVRAPFGATSAQIERFIAGHERWIRTHSEKLERARARQGADDKLSPEQLRALAEQAKRVIPARVEYYAQKIGVRYGRITIRNQRTRWGSCSSRGNLNFNCLLMLTPPEVVDSVVVHELCHRLEMNHSERFYSEVLRVFPDYWKWHRWLKENGAAIMSRVADER